MASFGALLHIHPVDPQPRLIEQAVAIVRNEGVLVYPTDSGYALGCMMGDKQGMERIARIRMLDKNHHFSLMCKDLADSAQYAHVDTPTYRFLKEYTPGPFTLILNATREVPRRLQNSKKKTIGIRICAEPIVQKLLEGLRQPLLTVSLVGANALQAPVSELQAEDTERLRLLVDVIIDGGSCGTEFTTVVDLTTGVPHVLRAGAGKIL